MGCPYPIKIKNERYLKDRFRYGHRGDLRVFNKKYFYVPCGKCLSCMISKRTWLNTACNWEYNYYGCGSFTTLTYNEVEYLNLYNEEDNKFYANYEDFQLFMKRLKQDLYRKYGKRIDFKFLAVAEQGGQTNRWHYHVLFFGLDYKLNDLDIWNAWGKGIVDNRPIKAGGINYVLKYMDKDDLRRKNNIDYDFTEEHKPFLKHSLGLGKGFILEHLDDIIEHDGTYDRGDGKRHSLPAYWLNKLMIKPVTDYTEVKKQMSSERNNGGPPKDDFYTISKSEVINYLMNRNKHQEEVTIQKSRDEGKPQIDFDDLYFNSIKEEMELFK